MLGSFAQPTSENMPKLTNTSHNTKQERDKHFEIQSFYSATESFFPPQMAGLFHILLFRQNCLALYLVQNDSYTASHQMSNVSHYKYNRNKKC